MPINMLLTALSALFPHDRFSIDPDICYKYSADYSQISCVPRAVVFPINEDEIIALVKFCLAQRIALTARGAGTGTCGAAVPLSNGIVVSFDRMQKIIHIDPQDRYAIVEAGVINGVLQTALREKGFFWGPDPGSLAECTIGGNIACNAAGPEALKYGATRDNVLGLTAITGTGLKLECGGYTSKRAAAYDFTRLIIGSEGTLALISKAILKLTPLPLASQSLRLSYSSLEAAAAAVTAIMASSVTPSALEFFDDTVLKLIRQAQPDSVNAHARAALLIKVDGDHSSLSQMMNTIMKAAHNDHLLFSEVALKKNEADELWQIRKLISPLLRQFAPQKLSEDIVIPVTQLVTFIKITKQFQEKFNIPIVNYGHAGNGNLHVNLLLNDENKINQELCLQALFSTVIDLKGAISGEHGIGLLKKPYLNHQFSPEQIQFMQAIKNQFDPASILNPNKIFMENLTTCHRHQ